MIIFFSIFTVSSKLLHMIISMACQNIVSNQLNSQTPNYTHWVLNHWRCKCITAVFPGTLSSDSISEFDSVFLGTMVEMASWLCSGNTLFIRLFLPLPCIHLAIIGYIYWRLLSTSPQAAKEVVLAEKPLISEETDCIEPTLLNELICNIGTLASVYHKPASTFVDGSSYIAIPHLGQRLQS